MNKRINSRRFDQLDDHFQENLFQKEKNLSKITRLKSKCTTM